jgi:hypothetical protein
MGPGRFERPTPSLSETCSNQLSYEPDIRFVFPLPHCSCHRPARFPQATHAKPLGAYMLRTQEAHDSVCRKAYRIVSKRIGKTLFGVFEAPLFRSLRLLRASGGWNAPLVLALSGLGRDLVLQVALQ